MRAPEAALVVNDASSEERLAMAAAALERCERVVVLEGIARLRPAAGEIVCEVVDPMPGAHRCAEEFKVLIENAGRHLARSELARRMPRRPLRWRVVDEQGAEAVQVWPADG